MNEMLAQGPREIVVGRYSSLKKVSNNLTKNIPPKSSAQVARWVAPPVSPNTAGQSPEPKKKRKKQSHGVKLREGELEIVRFKAEALGMTVNAYIRAKALDDNYVAKPPEWLRAVLLKLYAELAGQGNNLNQIARKVNMRAIAADEAILILDKHRVPVFEVLKQLQEALTGKRPPDVY